jgi:MFS family permease
VLSLITWGILGDRLGNRLLISGCWMVIAIIGIIMIIAVPAHHPTARLVGYYLTQASATPFVALLSLISTNVAGYTKKTTVAAMYLIAYCAGNIIGNERALGRLHTVNLADAGQDLKHFAMATMFQQKSRSWSVGAPVWLIYYSSGGTADARTGKRRPPGQCQAT